MWVFLDRELMDIILNYLILSVFTVSLFLLLCFILYVPAKLIVKVVEFLIKE